MGVGELESEDQDGSKGKKSFLRRKRESDSVLARKAKYRATRKIVQDAR